MFCIAVGFVGAGFASPILRRLGGGIPAFCLYVNEESNLGAFLCTLHYSEERSSRDVFSGFWPCYPRCVVGQVRIVTAHLFNFGRKGLHFALWLVLAVLALPPLF